jgi:hypothetical protein
MILFCGDPHGHFCHIIEAVQEHQPAAVILLGDLQAQRPLEDELALILDKTEVWFIHGNRFRSRPRSSFWVCHGRPQLAWQSGRNCWPTHCRTWPNAGAAVC